jgi:uncharacterized protein (TIGR02001 family)
MRAGGIQGWLAAACLAGTIAALPAQAETSVSLTIDSDYRFRGYSLSEDQPDVRLNLSYDHPSGAYAGLSVYATRRAGLASYVGYAGYVWRPANGPKWEAGVTATHVRDHENYDYSEIYGGVITQAFTARVYYSPNYFNSRSRTLYTEINTGQQISSRWRVFAHAGYLTPLSGHLRRNRYDVRVGASLNVSHYVVQAAWSQSTPQPAYPYHSAFDGQALIVSVSDFF